MMVRLINLEIYAIIIYVMIKELNIFIKITEELVLREILELVRHRELILFLLIAMIGLKIIMLKI